MPLPLPRIVEEEERPDFFGPPLQEGVDAAIGGEEEFDIGRRGAMLPSIPNLPRVDLQARAAPTRDQGRFKRNRTLAALGLVSASLGGSGPFAQSGAGLARGAAANELAAEEEFSAAMQGFEEFQAEGQQFNLEQTQREQELAFEQEQSAFDAALGQQGRERIQALIARRQENIARIEQDLKENDPLQQERIGSEQALQEQRRASARRSDRGPDGRARAAAKSVVTGRTARPPRAIERDMASARIDLETAKIALDGQPGRPETANLDPTKEGDLTRRVRQAQLKVQQLQEELIESRTLFGTRDRSIGAVPVGDPKFGGGAQPGGAQPGGAQPGGAQPGGAQPGGAQPGGAQPGGAQPGGAQQVAALPSPSAFAGTVDVGDVIGRVDTEIFRDQVEIREVLSFLIEDVIETGNPQAILQFAAEALRLGAITQEDFDSLRREFPETQQ